MDTFPRPHWLDLVDVLVISYFVHRIYLLFRGTRAFQVAASLGILWGIGWIGNQADLELTGWFFGLVEVWAPIAIIVIFRNEIREALLQSNPIRLFLGRPDSIKTVDVAVMAEAVFELAHARTGALIVFQNRDRIDELAREGTRIDAHISTHLLHSLFSKDSPVHDGAAVIRRGRIDRIGTFLPLSVRRDLPPEFGTRHRAAIGLSELSDALVLVISEERGDVSLVRRGQVELIETAEALERELASRLTGMNLFPRRSGRAEAGRQIAGFVATVMVVGILWGLYNSQSIVRKKITVPIEFQGLPAHLEFLNSPETIDVEVQGRQSRIDSLAKGQVSVTADLSGVRSGGHFEFESSEVHVTRPSGVHVHLDSPVRVHLRERTLHEVEVRAKVADRDQLPDGFEYVISIEPPRVALNLPVEHQDVETVETKVIRLSELGLGPDRTEATLEVPLELDAISARPVENQINRVQITVQLRRTSTTPSDP